MSDPAKAAIERVQPFHKPHPEALDHPLWLVHEMEITDKHKLLVVLITRAALEHFIYSGDWPEDADKVKLLSVSPAALSSNTYAELARIEAPPSMNVQAHVSKDIVFEQVGTSRHEPVIPCLFHLSNAVTEIIDQFDASFFP